MSKRRYKAYLWDQSAAVPKTTRWRKDNEFHLHFLGQDDTLPIQTALDDVPKYFGEHTHEGHNESIEDRQSLSDNYSDSDDSAVSSVNEFEDDVASDILNESDVSALTELTDDNYEEN